MLSLYHVTGTVLRVFCTLSHSISTTAFWGRNYCDSHMQIKKKLSIFALISVFSPSNMFPRCCILIHHPTQHSTDNGRKQDRDPEPSLNPVLLPTHCVSTNKYLTFLSFLISKSKALQKWFLCFYLILVYKSMNSFWSLAAWRGRHFWFIWALYMPSGCPVGSWYLKFNH